MDSQTINWTMIWSQKHVHPPLVSVWFSFVEFHIHIPCLIKNIQFWDSSPWLIWNLPPILKLSGSKSKLGRVDCRQRTTNILIFNNLENWYNLSTAFCPLPEHMVCGDIIRERPTFWNDFHLSILKWRPAYSDCVMRIAALWHFIYLTSDESKWFGIT